MADTWTHDDLRRFCDLASDHNEEWQGIPVPLDGMPLQLHDRHPLAAKYREIWGPAVRVDVLVGGPEEVADDEQVVNTWYSRKLQSDVYVFRRTSTGRAFGLKVPRAPDMSMDRLKLWLQTLGASDAWGLDAEAKALDKLQGLVTERQLRHYLLTGSFLETSQRSGLTYMFRRLRPTVVLSPRGRRPEDDEMRCLAVLCLHPIGYYTESWGGCMVPTDDVLAHLLAMRGDEAYFWRCANQHAPWRPEAGL